MTPAASILEPNSNPALYVAAVLTLSWFDRGVPIEVVETALLLACLRRRTRPTDVPPLQRVRSLAYFQPIIDELLEHPAPGGYLQYLRLKLRGILDSPGPAKVQKSTFSDDR